MPPFAHQLRRAALVPASKPGQHAVCVSPLPTPCVLAHRLARAAPNLDAGFLHRGLAFGELALVNPRKPRTSTVTAGKDGAHLATLHRGALNHLRFTAETQVGRGT